jgi:hypothetical protein
MAGDPILAVAGKDDEPPSRRPGDHVGTAVTGEVPDRGHGHEASQPAGQGDRSGQALGRTPVQSQPVAQLGDQVRSAISVEVAWGAQPVMPLPARGDLLRPGPPPLAVPEDQPEVSRLREHGQVRAAVAVGVTDPGHRTHGTAASKRRAGA